MAGRPAKRARWSAEALQGSEGWLLGEVSAWYAPGERAFFGSGSYGWVERLLPYDSIFSLVEHLRFEAVDLSVGCADDWDGEGWRRKQVLCRFAGRNEMGQWTCSFVRPLDAAGGREIETRTAPELWALRCEPKLQYSVEELSSMGLRPEGLLDLLLCWAVLRECARRHKLRPGKSAGLRFEAALRRLAPEQAERLGRVAQQRFPCPSGAKAASLQDAFQAVHFTNAFHEDDAHNSLLASVAPLLSPAALVAFVALAYYTGNRRFVQALVEHVRDVAGEAERQSIADSPERFFEEAVGRWYGGFRWELKEYPSLFHRRYRPMAMEDNRVRKLYAQLRASGADAAQASRALTEHGLAALDQRALAVAEAAEEVVASAADYGSVYATLLDVLGEHGEAQFHAKNMANSLDRHIILTPGLESDRNGLGPGFRQMAHIRRGLGKAEDLLSEAQLCAELDEAVAYVAARWPWPHRQPLRRHVQSWYCELQKLLFFFRHGFPAHPSRRHQASCTPASTAALASKYR